jgi:Putative MetA-pathway of phenol degradation
MHRPHIHRPLRASCAAFALVAGMIAVNTSRAAHPYITDDTNTQGASNWQLELIGEHVRHDRSASASGSAVRQVRRITTLNPILTYGVRDNLDVALGITRLRESIKENGVVVDSANGMADSTVELKWRIHDANGLSFALKPGLVIPTGNESRGLGTGRLSWGLNSILTYEAKPWTWLVNLAYAEQHFKRADDANANHRHLWRFSAGLAYNLNDQWRLVGEAGIRTNPARDDPFLPGRNGNFVMLGWIYSPTDKFDLDAGVRRSTNRGELDTAILLGATVRW